MGADGTRHRRLRVAVAGTGFVGRLHVRAARCAGAEVAGVAASSPERSRLAAAELDVEHAFRSAEALAEADDVDVVVVCTPNELHAPLVELALATGKHVVCEKPLATSIEAAEKLHAAAAAAGVVAAVPFVYRFHPVAREARERAHAGALGRVHLLHGTYLQDWLAGTDDANWRVDASQGGPSRAFADIGSHWCDLVEFISGHRITRLTARTAIVVAERPAAGHTASFDRGGPSADRRAVTTEDTATVLFETDGGATGSVVVSQVAPGRKNRLVVEVNGTDGSLVFDQEQAESLWLGRRDGAALVRRDPAELSAAARRFATLPGGHAQGYADCIELFLADVFAAIRDPDTVPGGLPTFADGFRAVQLTEAVLRSAATQTWVDVPMGST